MHYCTIFFFIHLCFSLIPATLTKRVSQCPLTYSYQLTSLSFNINITQTGFPIPTLKGNTLQDLEQEVLSYDKLYLNLRGMDLVLDFSDNGGLWLLLQYFKNVIPHSVVAALRPHFHFAQCRDSEAVGVR